MVAIDHFSRKVACIAPLEGLSAGWIIESLEFESWYNAWRPHMALEGLRPDDPDYDRKPGKPKRDAKTVPGNVERHIFLDARLTGYRIENAA